ncbi:MAG: cbb3-type cytochrome oxidase assembly protein CcoS [Bacteriovoracaceae bacterium]|nr:cbb3-type cytochrome oxidase assembly protein CcoS [Bacteriovoracaceae bacterium]
MEVIVILVPLALLLGLTFIVGFIWMASKGQYDDLETPRLKMLLDDQKVLDKEEKRG